MDSIMGTPVNDEKRVISELRSRIAGLEERLERATAERDRLREEVKLLRQRVGEEPHEDSEIEHHADQGHLRHVHPHSETPKQSNHGVDSVHVEPNVTTGDAPMDLDERQSTAAMLTHEDHVALPNTIGPQTAPTEASSPMSSLTSFTSSSAVGDDQEADLMSMDMPITVGLLVAETEGSVGDVTPLDHLPTDEGDRGNNSTSIDIPSNGQAETPPLTQGDAAGPGNKRTNGPSHIDTDGATTQDGDRLTPKSVLSSLSDETLHLEKAMVESRSPENGEPPGEPSHTPILGTVNSRASPASVRSPVPVREGGLDNRSALSTASVHSIVDDNPMVPGDHVTSQRVHLPTIDTTPCRQTVSIPSPASAPESSAKSVNTPPASPLASSAKSANAPPASPLVSSSPKPANISPGPTLALSSPTHANASPTSPPTSSLKPTDTSRTSPSTSSPKPADTSPASPLASSAKPSSKDVALQTPSCSAPTPPKRKKAKSLQPLQQKRPQTRGSSKTSSASHISSHSEATLEDKIRASYGMFALDGARLQWSSAPPDCRNLGNIINLSAVARTKAELTVPIFNQLCNTRDEVLSSFPRSSDRTTNDIHLVRRIYNAEWAPKDPQTLPNVVLELATQLVINKTDRNLIRFLMCSILAVIKYLNEEEYEEVAQKISEHELRMTLAHLSLHHVLNGLGEHWKGMHFLVLAFLLRNPTNSLKACFQAPTLPATLQLFQKKFDDSGFIQAQYNKMHDLIDSSVPNDRRLAFEQWTPLSVLENLVVRAIDMSHVATALGYDSQYRERAVPAPSTPLNNGPTWSPQDLFTYGPLSFLSTPTPTPAKSAPVGRTTPQKRRRNTFDDESPSKRQKTDDKSPDFQIGNTPPSSSSAKPSQKHDDHAIPRYRKLEWKLNDTPSSLKRKRSSIDTNPRKHTRYNEQTNHTGAVEEPESDGTATDESVQAALATASSVVGSATNDDVPHHDLGHNKTADQAADAKDTKQTQEYKDMALAQRLRDDVMSFAEELKANEESIWTTENVPSMVAGVCDADSVLRLDPDEWYNDELINTIPCVGIHTRTTTWLLPSWVHTKMKRQEFEEANRWVKDLRPKKLARWVFGFCEKHHWRAVMIDFDAKTIFGYDPQKTKLTAYMKGKLQIVKEWVQQIDHGSWELKRSEGPFHPYDFMNCGVYVSWILRQWVLERVIRAGSDVDALQFRRDSLALLHNAPRVPGLPAEGKGEIASDSSSIHEISEEEFHATKGCDAESQTKPSSAVHEELPVPQEGAGGEQAIGPLVDTQQLPVQPLEPAFGLFADTEQPPVPEQGADDAPGFRFFANPEQPPVLPQGTDEEPGLRVFASPQQPPVPPQEASIEPVFRVFPDAEQPPVPQGAGEEPVFEAFAGAEQQRTYAFLPPEEMVDYTLYAFPTAPWDLQILSWANELEGPQWSDPLNGPQWEGNEDLFESLP